jgi:hypothetical protein
VALDCLQVQWGVACPHIRVAGLRAPSSTWRTALCCKGVRCACVHRRHALPAALDRKAASAWALARAPGWSLARS